MKRLHWIAATIALGLVALVLVGCGSGGFSKRARQAKGNVFRYPLPTTPTTFDPGSVRDGDTIDLLQQVYEGLVQWGEDGTPTGLLAESWDIEDGGKTFVFKIRPGVKFHSGRTLEAADFKRSIERNARLKGSDMASAYLSDIVGLEEYVNDSKSGKGAPREIPGIEVRDASTIAFHLKKPTPYFVGKLTYPVAAAIDVDSAPEGSDMTKIPQMVGTGPFRIVRYEPQQTVILEPFADYFAGRPKLDRIERPVILDAFTRLSKYKAGELDLVQLERQDVASLEADPVYKSQLKFFDRPAVWYIGMNPTLSKVFKDRRVRQAVAMAIDRKKIVEDLMGGINTTATGIVPKNVPGHRDNAAVLPYAPAKARELLAEAGYPGGQGFPEVTLSFREGRPDVKLVAEAVLSQLDQNLGIKVRLREMEWGAYLQKENTGELEFFHMRWAADYLDPQNFLSHMLASWGPENNVGYHNEEFDDLCRRADSMMDMNQRLPLYARAEDIVLQDAIWVPIYYQRDVELHRKELHGLRESPAGHLPHTQVTIEAD